MGVMNVACNYLDTIHSRTQLGDFLFSFCLKKRHGEIVVSPLHFLTHWQVRKRNGKHPIFSALPSFNQATWVTSSHRSRHKSPRSPWKSNLLPSPPFQPAIWRKSSSPPWIIDQLNKDEKGEDEFATWKDEKNVDVYDFLIFFDFSFSFKRSNLEGHQNNPY